MGVGFLLTPTSFLDDCHADCGDYFTLRPARDRTLVITADPAAIKQVFTGDPALLHAGAGNVVLAPILGSGSVLLLDGREHLRHRRLLLAPFRGERMRAHADTMREVAERHVAGWPRDRRFGVLPSMQAITLEIILRAVFGVTDPAQMARLGEPLRQLLDMVSPPRRVLALGLTATRTTGPLSPWRRFAAARAAADRVIHEEITARRRELDAGGPDRDDIFSMLVAARDDDGRALTDDELRDELMTLLVAGHETTATALSWTLERVTRHPDVLAQLRSEQSSGEGTAYLDAVIKETLRLRPVVPAVVRQLQQPMTFGPWDLPAGVNIAPSIYLLHRRADLYPDPTAFRPERFLERTPGTYEWIPFGGGVRRCLGAGFALLEMREVLSVVLSDAAPRAQTARPESTARRAITFAPARGGKVLVGA
ncbi:MAG: cytochrome [Solirubrobacterales bacterium]|nr:cytochrome [Solirubrobacterales bacterium]